MILRSLALRILALLPVSFLIAGCGLTPTTITTAALGLSLHGSVHGGQQPINGAHVYLFAADSGGYGNPSDSLLTAGATGFSDSIGAYVPTGSDGSWNISGDYTCTPNTQVYLYALGGDPGAGVNSAAGLMAVLGNCPSTGTFATSVPFISINEVTTVAAAYAMAGYAVDATHVASSSTAASTLGIANAFANAGNLADLPSGTALATTPNGNGVVPQMQINLLANIVASCINSTGPGSSTCSTLLGDATSDGTVSGTAPTDTATAAINIAHNPGANIADLFNLPSAIVPFAPTASTQPNDFTLSLQFTDASLNGPVSVAIDAQGNAWAANQTGNTLTVLSSLGIPVTGSPFSGNGLNAPGQIAIDANGNAWVTNTNDVTLSAFGSTGSALSGSPFSGGGLQSPNAIAIDVTGDVWATSPTTNNVTLLTAGPVVYSITDNSLAAPDAVAIDQTGNAWVLNYNGNSVTLLANNGTPQPNSPITGVAIDEPYGVSIDGSGNAWIANYGNNTLTVLNSSGAAISGSPFSVGGLSMPSSIAFDGAGNVWVANLVGQGVTELTSTGAAVTGSPFVASSLSNPYSIAVDGAGSVWLANSSGNSLTQIIGAAVPAVTPMATALASNKIGARP